MLLLIIVYLVFVGVGLPDSLLGTAWPFIRDEFGFMADGAGALSVLISLGIIAASLLCCHIAERGGFRLCASIGLACLSAALFGYAAAGQFWQLCLLSLLLGFGSGTLQTLFNDFVARNYGARHMNWLQGAWGIGAVLGPLILSAAAAAPTGWRCGYFMVALAEMLIMALFWLGTTSGRKQRRGDPADREKKTSVGGGRVRLKGKALLVGQYFLYCSMENSIMLWGASYLIEEKAMSSTVAAETVSLFFMGLTVGRLLCGFLPEKAGCTRVIGTGAVTAAALNVLILSSGGGGIGFLFFLLGCAMAPQYPMLLKVSPALFPEEPPQMIMGIQVASAYLGILLIPPALGKAFTRVSFGILPVVEAVCLLGVWGCVTVLHKRVKGSYQNGD